MKLSLLSLFVMVFMLSVGGEAGGLINCENPKGEDGESHTEGCLKQLCTNGVWVSSLDDTVCCYENEAFQPNTLITTTTAQDGCTTTSMVCMLDGNKARMVFNVENNCAKQLAENKKDELEGRA